MVPTALLREGASRIAVDAPIKIELDKNVINSAIP
jgi:hypothetical protein